VQVPFRTSAGTSDTLTEISPDFPQALKKIIGAVPRLFHTTAAFQIFSDSSICRPNQRYDVVQLPTGPENSSSLLQ
jgi:hypothetical protein